MSLVSRSWTSPDSPPSRRSTFAAAVIGVVLTIGGIGSAVAQNATPEASPAANWGGCLGDGGTDVAATPVPETATGVTDPAVIDGSTQALTTFYTCVGDALGDSAFGLTFQVGSIVGVSDLGDGSYAVEHQATFGKQLLQGIAVVSDVDGTMTVTSVAPTDVEISGDSATLTVVFGGEDPAAFLPESSEIRPSVIFQTTNSSAEATSLLVLQVPEGFDPASITGTELPTGVTAIGLYEVGSGVTTGAVFQGLTAGSYAVISTTGEAAMLSLTEPEALDVPDIFASPEASPAT